MELAKNYHDRWNIFCNSFPHILRSYLPDHCSCLRGMEGELSAMPNILMYGMHGFPLDILWKHSLMMRFGAKSVSAVQCTWGKEIQYMETPYYIHIDLENPFIPKDIDLLQEFLKTIITTRSMLCDRHIIVLENIDSLARDASMNSFRVLLERFSKNVWFVCTTYRISRIEAPIRSRFYCIRVPLPKEEAISRIIMHLDGKTENIPVQTRNLMLALTMPQHTDPEMQWMACTPFPPVCDYILNTKTPTIEGIRAIIHRAFQCGITISGLAMSIIETCSRRGDSDTMIHAITSEFARCEHMSSQSKGMRSLLYMEYMLHLVMLVLPTKKKDPD